MTTRTRRPPPQRGPVRLSLPAVPPRAADHDLVVYLREVDAGTDCACWIVCAKGDPGAVAFVPDDAPAELRRRNARDLMRRDDYVEAVAAAAVSQVLGGGK